MDTMRPTPGSASLAALAALQCFPVCLISKNVTASKLCKTVAHQHAQQQQHLHFSLPASIPSVWPALQCEIVADPQQVKLPARTCTLLRCASLVDVLASQVAGTQQQDSSLPGTVACQPPQ
jgi:hypothetical protein